MRRDDLIPTDLPAETPAAPRRAAPPWLLRALPGALAALLFGALALGGGVFGGAARAAQVALAVALAASVVAQPGLRRALRRLWAWPELPHSAALAGVTLLALLLRTWGLRFGLPYLDHPDEWAVADEAVRMLQTGDFRPVKWDYPTLYMYLQVVVAAAHFLWGAGAGLYRELGDLAPQHYYPWMRALTAALGTAAVPLTYALGRRLYGRAVGLAGAALLAVLPLAAGDAHYVTTDTPAMFFSLLAMLMIARLGLGTAEPQSGKGEGRGGAAPLRTDPLASAAPGGGGERGEAAPRLASAAPGGGDAAPYAQALLAGLATGLAAATKYNVAALVVALALALVLAGRAEGKRHAAHGKHAAATFCAFFLVPCALAALGLLTGFTLGMPLWLPELRNVLEGLASIVVHYRIDGHPGAESSRPALFYWGALANDGLLLALAVLAGIALAFVRRSRADLLLLAFVVPTVLQLAGVKVVFARNLMPLLPLLCLLAAAALEALVSVAVSTHHEATRTQRAGASSRLRAAMVRPGFALAAVVVLVAAQPIAQAVRDELLRARPTTRVLATEWVQANAPDGARVWLEDGTLLLPARLRAEGGQPITSHPPEWYRERGFRFLVALLDRDDKDPVALAAFGEPVARFERGGVRHGPALAVYDTGAGDPWREERTPSGATLAGGALVLEGYRHAGQVRAGETLPLALYWHAARQLPADYTVFVHLLDAQGGKAAQRDTAPLGGSLPTSRWPPGQLIRDDQDLAVPPEVTPGTYRLVVGMYDAATLAAITDAGPIDLGEVVVTAR